MTHATPDAFFALGAGTPAAPLPKHATVLVFDVETDGGRARDGPGAPGQRVVQIAWLECARDGAVLAEHCVLVALTEGRRLLPLAQRIHKLSAAALSRAGDALYVLPRFFESVDRVRANRGVVVAHNAAADVKSVNNTAEAVGLWQRLALDECFCTFRASQRVFGSALKNAALHERLVGAALEASALHDALYDARITMESFFAGRSQGRW